jgi:hypothetical protein
MTISVILILCGVCLLVHGQPPQESETTGVADPDVVPQTLNVSSSSTDATISQLVATIAALKIEFSQQTVATRVQIFGQIADARPHPLPAEAAASILAFLTTTAARSLDEHAWTYDQLESYSGAKGMLLLLGHTLSSTSRNGGLTLNDATRARRFCSTVAGVIARNSVPDSQPFVFGDGYNGVQLHVSSHSPNKWPARVGGGGNYVNVDQFGHIIDEFPTATTIALITIGHKLYGRTLSEVGAVAVEVFTADGKVVSINQLKMPVRFGFYINPLLNRSRAQCVYWDQLGWSSDGCTVSTSSDNVGGDCLCTHLRGDFAVVSALPPGSAALTAAPAPGDDGDDTSRYLWLLILLLLLLCVVALILFFLVRQHRKKKPLEGADTLAPYVDKAAGMGVLALLGDGDVSDSSELERHDYSLPKGKYVVPDETESSDLRRSDFSFALEGESEMLDTRHGAAGANDDEDDAAELGRNDTYRPKTRLAAPAAVSATTRDALSTNIDLSQSQSSIDDAPTKHSSNAAATEKELKRQAGTTATTRN